ncbi:MAG: hypothetical protein AB1797_02885 [bacterium]
MFRQTLIALMGLVVITWQAEAAQDRRPTLGRKAIGSSNYRLSFYEEA